MGGPWEAKIQKTQLSPLRAPRFGAAAGFASGEAFAFALTLAFGAAFAAEALAFGNGMDFARASNERDSCALSHTLIVGKVSITLNTDKVC